MPTDPDPAVWSFSRNPVGKPVATCLVCLDGRARATNTIATHEATHSHKRALQHYQEHLTEVQSPSTPELAENLNQSSETRDEVIQKLSEMGIDNLLASLAGVPSVHVQVNASPGPATYTETMNNDIMAWNLYEGNTELDDSPEAEGVRRISQAILEGFDAISIVSSGLEADSSNSRPESPVDVGPDSEDDEQPTDKQGPRKRTRTSTHDDPSEEWFPWHDKITATLDILMHLPRSVFSKRQLDLFLWLLRENGVNDVPSVRTMEALNEKLQKMCGIETIQHEGALGHRYYVNSLSQIIAQARFEMANPKVRPFLRDYPRDAGPQVSEACEAERWLHDVPDDLTTPMARIGSSDFYIHEPAMLRNAQCVIPVRWFNKKDDNNRLYAHCWEMSTLTTDQGSGWRVTKSKDLVVCATELLKNFPELCRDSGELYSLPDPTSILDVYDPDNDTHGPWLFTKAEDNYSNRWRVLAGGSRVVAFPIWMYCDDTSGNLSKKWNKHNSFLFTAAGLPHTESQKEYNIHFLSTSNIAPPLEMLDGIVDQLELAQEHGIWAWDIRYSEAVLVLPFILAMLGDNPMQSEFACHIGMRGKYFCRVCKVKGSDVQDEPKPSKSQPTTSATASDSDLDSNVSESDDGMSEASEDVQPPSKGQKRGKKTSESLANMINRIENFIKPGVNRTKEETQATLKSLFDQSKSVGNQTKIKAIKTEKGVKDTYQQHFLDALHQSYKRLRGTASKTAALKEKLKDMRENPTSPVWRISGLDPHRDTPVEILHVVLLGFVKYFWRDAITNQIGKNEVKKQTLITRLNSQDVSGLGVPPLAGQTLVQYAGSLTGPDFRVIAQVAPFVLYDLVSPECFDAWHALSQVIPLIWQPHIPDIDKHIDELQARIDHFLITTARWTPQWFNKAKFHLITHLPRHIRSMGPAPLFATEAFESFNAIIRAKSVHSNRQAPSRDIAKAFAQGNRVRHLVSGGLFLMRDAFAKDSESSTSGAPTPPKSRSDFVLAQNALQWKAAGRGPSHLIAHPSTLTQYLGLGVSTRFKTQLKTGTCKIPKTPAQRFYATQTSQVLSNHPNIIYSTNERATGWFHTAVNVTLQNGDEAKPGSHVIIRRDGSSGETFVACVREIVQRAHSPSSLVQMCDSVLVQEVNVTTHSPLYKMPFIRPSPQLHILTSVTDILCVINAQHNCIGNKCDTSATRPIFQERERTKYTTARVQHRGNQNDLLLNTAQMRDAVHLQRYSVRMPKLPPDEVRRVVTQSAVKSILKTTDNVAPQKSSIAKKALHRATIGPSPLTLPQS